jgi:hypothetical protein
MGFSYWLVADVEFNRGFVPSRGGLLKPAISHSWYLEDSMPHLPLAQIYWHSRFNVQPPYQVIRIQWYQSMRIHVLIVEQEESFLGGFRIMIHNIYISNNGCFRIHATCSIWRCINVTRRDWLKPSRAVIVVQTVWAWWITYTDPQFWRVFALVNPEGWALSWSALVVKLYRAKHRKSGNPTGWMINMSLFSTTQSWHVNAARCIS